MQIKTFRRVSLLILGTVIVFLVLFKFSEIQEILNLLKKAKWYFLIFALITQALTYLFVAFTFRGIFRILGYRLKFSKLYKVALLSTFLSEMAPSAGLSTMAFMVYSFKKDKISAGKTTIMSVIAYILVAFSFFVLLGVSLIYLLVLDTDQKDQVKIIALISAIIFLFAFLLFVLASRKKRIKTIVHFLLSKFNFIFLKIFKRKILEKSKVDFIIDEFYLGAQEIAKDKGKLLLPLASAFLYHFADIFTVYFIFFAFGITPHLGIVSLGYILACFFTYASFIPTGLGIFEVSMTVIYLSLGIPYETALITTLVFRALGFWLPIPIGFFVYRNLLKE